MQNGADAFTKSHEQLIELGNRNVEAMAEASKIAATGMEQITQEVLTSVRTSFEDGFAVTRAAITCKDPQELFDLQTTQFRKFVDSWITEGTKLSEMSLKTFTDAMAPINSRVNENVEKIVKTA